MRARSAVSAIVGLSMTALATPAFAAGSKAATAPATAYTTSQVQRLGAAAFKRKLRAAKGVGLIQKLKVAALVNRFAVDFYWFHKGKGGKTLAQLRARFNTIHAYVAKLVAPENPALHATLMRSRAALWRAFADRRLYAAGFGHNVIRRIEGHDAQLAANWQR
jgi:hypothetical protein